MSFYITLPSTASMKEFPENKQSNYTTLFRPPIELRGDYEVALTDISCSNLIEMDLGTITIPNPFAEASFFGRSDQFIIQIKAFNTESTLKFVERLNAKIYHRVAYEEFVYRTELTIPHTEMGPLFSMGYIHGRSRIPQTDDELILLNNGETFEVLDLNKDSERAEIMTANKIKFDNDTFRWVWSQKDTKATDAIKAAFKCSEIIVPRRDSTNRPDLNYIRGDLPGSDDPVQADIDNFLKKTYKMPHLVYSHNSIKVIYENRIGYKIDGLVKEFISPGTEFSIFYQKTHVFEAIPANVTLINYATVITDLIDDQFYGDSRSPVLYTLNLGNHSRSFTSFDNLYYLPVKKSQLSSINIQIRDLTGKFIRFSDPFFVVLIKLHFRKK